MKITVTGRKVNLRENFKELAQKKLSRFDRIFDEEAVAAVVVTVERKIQTVEITIRHKGMMYRAEASCPEMNEALDQVISALGRQIRKNKSRLDKKIHSAALDQYIAEWPDLPQEEEQEYKIVRTKHFSVKPMDVEEAILQMNLLGHTFYMFRNHESNEVCVVYRRKNGDYGLLEPNDA